MAIRGINKVILCGNIGHVSGDSIHAVRRKD